MAQVALDLEHLAEQADRLGVVLRGVLQPAAEFPGQRLFGQIGDVGAHAGDGQAAGGYAAGAPVLSALPVWIGEDGLTADLLEGDVLGRVV